MSSLESRFDTHEAVCVERFDELNKDIKELKGSVKALLEAVSMGRGAVRMLFGLGVLLAAIWTGIKIIKEWV